MSLRLTRSCALAALALVSLGPVSHAASLAYGTNDVIDVSIGDETSSLIGNITRRINVDGRPVDISVSVRNVLVAATAAARSFPASVNVSLDSGDGQDLPEITAIRVKLERVKPPVRIYRSTLYPEATLVYDPHHAGYGAELTSFYPGVQLKATVTVTTPNETRIVNIGKVRVRPPSILAQPDLTD